ncbi:uncharacterized protein LOC124125940 [Haliotis rufescens]|uniref:uncharacterized protein LOC124125940 n=1 Tax=Haliotis rufescens TaxID=6454 RepID=UPI00201F2C7E|nr:uncharacterized protein LOC124125940 [Haliotis rufescens]
MALWMVLLLLVGATGDVHMGSHVFHPDYAHPLVFDPVFYVNAYSDLGQLATPQIAKDHWLNHGIDEGRQGSGQFHSKQYLKRNAEISRAFGQDYKAAIKHFLEFGQYEHLQGYVLGGYNGRYTMSVGHLFISASARMGGAIDSLVWGKKEFINAWDHGREIQTTINAIPYGECFNPTEAGGASDYKSPTTKSVLQNITVNANVMTSTVYPAFWIRAGSHEVNNRTRVCMRGSPAVNTVDTYNHAFSKVVTIGCAGVDYCIKYESGFEIAGKWPKYDFINLVAPAVYLTANFTNLLNYNPENHQLQPHTKSTWPPIYTTPDHKYALGVYAPDGQDTDMFMYYLTGQHDGNFANKTNSMHVVFRKRPFPDASPRHLAYVTYICVGNVDMVADCLRRLQNTLV